MSFLLPENTNSSALAVCSGAKTVLQFWGNFLRVVDLFRTGMRLLFFCSLSATFHPVMESLRRKGHNVLWVVTLEEAASFAATAQFDLVLMSSERGHSELNALADLAEECHLPFVIVGTATKDIECRAVAVLSLSNTANHLERWITTYLT